MTGSETTGADPHAVHVARVIEALRILGVEADDSVQSHEKFAGIDLQVLSLRSIQELVQTDTFKGSPLDLAGALDLIATLSKPPCVISSRSFASDPDTLWV